MQPHTAPDLHETFLLWKLCEQDSPLSLRHEQTRFQVRAWNRQSIDLENDASHMGVVFDGLAKLTTSEGSFDLTAGMFFHIPTEAEVRGTASGQLISQFGFRGLFQIGGPVEQEGRLKYIDGCSDTLLISPSVRGESCLNLLFLPAGTQQTAHTHPSFRTGLILSGHGICRTMDGDHSLAPGMAFVIPAGVLHSFHTSDESLRVIAFHPDSDFGPCHDDHPMVNRTIVNGISAAQLTHEQRHI